MNRFVKVGLLAAVGLSMSACTRIETGTVGVRTDASRNILKEELLAGSWNQTMFGDVDVYPFKDVSVEVRDMTPLAADNSTIKEFDVAVVYSINPTSVADLYITKSRAFHATSEDGETFLMYNYMQQQIRAAAYKVARRYESLKLNDNRSEIEQLIRAEIINSLAEEKLDTSVTISQVLVKSVTPADSIVASANALVASQNANKQKAVEVQTAKLEAERIAALNANAGATKYMAATALQDIATGVKEGKVKTVVIPVDFKGIVQVTD